MESQISLACQNHIEMPWENGKQQILQHSNKTCLFYSLNISFHTFYNKIVPFLFKPIIKSLENNTSHKQESTLCPQTYCELGRSAAIYRFFLWQNTILTAEGRSKTVKNPESWKFYYFLAIDNSTNFSILFKRHINSVTLVSS